MVEAALIQPLLILVVLGLVLITIYFYECIKIQVDIHEELISRSEVKICEKNLLEVWYSELSINKNVQSGIGGISGYVLKKNIKGRYYVFREIDGIRLGLFENGANNENKND